MFKVGDAIIYPVYGSGTIEEIYEEQLGDTSQQYYQISFPSSHMSLSVPVNNAEDLGLRYPLPEEKLHDILEEMEKGMEVDEEIFSNLDSFGKEKLNTGKLHDAIELIAVLKEKERIRKRLSFNENKRMELAFNFIKSEAKLVLGDQAMLKLSALRD